MIAVMISASYSEPGMKFSGLNDLFYGWERTAREAYFDAATIPAEKNLAGKRRHKGTVETNGNSSFAA